LKTEVLAQVGKWRTRKIIWRERAPWLVNGISRSQNLVDVLLQTELRRDVSNFLRNVDIEVLSGNDCLIWPHLGPF